LKIPKEKTIGMQFREANVQMEGGGGKKVFKNGSKSPGHRGMQVRIAIFIIIIFFFFPWGWAQ